MAFNPNYHGKGYFLKVCDDHFIDLNGDIPTLCSIAKVPLRSYYSWYGLDSEFRQEMSYFKQALKDHDELSLRLLFNDPNESPKYRLQAYSLLYPQVSTESSEDADVPNIVLK